MTSLELPFFIPPLENKLKQSFFFSIDFFDPRLVWWIVFASTVLGFTRKLFHLMFNFRFCNFCIKTSMFTFTRYNWFGRWYNSFLLYMCQAQWMNLLPKNKDVKKILMFLFFNSKLIHGKLHKPIMSSIQLLKFIQRKTTHHVKLFWAQRIKNFWGKT